jgi:hypothetical protein
LLLSGDDTNKFLSLFMIAFYCSKRDSVIYPVTHVLPRL